MNGTSQKLRGCVATQLFSATPETCATHRATGNEENTRKPASIQELRAQLRAQPQCNQAVSGNAMVAPKVAPENRSISKVAQKKGMGFSERNCATDICGPYTPYCCPINLSLVDELHALIARYAALYKLAEDATVRIIDAAKKQAPATIADSVMWFQQEIDNPTKATK